MVKPEVNRHQNLLLPFFSAILVLLLFCADATAQNEYNVIQSTSSGPASNEWIHYRDAHNSLYHHLSGEAYKLLELRAETVSELHSRSDWKQRQREVRQILDEILGPFPEKTPLNPRIMGTIKKDFFTVEHIIYESQPDFYVTSSLFLPNDLQEPAPAIIYASGHTDVGYRSATYQHKILNLVKKGFIVFAFDPVSQGERLEYLDPDSGQSVVGIATREHSYSGTQAFITGSSLARFMTWDGIRAIDYLMTRDEVDPDRIGMTGRSGGGTQTACIAAMDDRIYAAAPEAYITNFTRLLQSIGPQDAEQNLYHGILRGIDHSDYLVARAPKPTLMITTTEDFFSIQGSRETRQELSGMYQALGNSDHFDMAEDGGRHTSTPQNREAMYAFFQKYLNLPGSPVDEDVQILSDEEIQVTPTGQLATSLGGETIFNLNRAQAKKQYSDLQESRSNHDRHLPAVVQNAKELSGYKEPSEVGEPVFTGRVQRDDYVIERYFIPGEGDYVIPYLLMIPEQSNNKALIYLHPSGKAAEAGEDGEIARLMRNGFTVLAPVLLHAAAFEQSIERVALLNPYISFRSIVMNRFYDPGFHLSAVAGSLDKYDLPDLAAVLAPGKLLIAGPTDAAGSCEDETGINKDTAYIQSVYELKNARNALKIIPCETGFKDQMNTILGKWLR